MMKNGQSDASIQPSMYIYFWKASKLTSQSASQPKQSTVAMKFKMNLMNLKILYPFSNGTALK